MKYFLLFFIFFLVQCNKDEKSRDGASSSNNQQRKDKLLAFSRDAPLELYCIVDGKLSSIVKDSLCNLNSHLYLDLTFIISENKLDSVSLVAGYLFDENGILVSHIKKFPSMVKILNELSKQELKPFAKTTDGNYGISVDCRRFCRDLYK